MLAMLSSWQGKQVESCLNILFRRLVLFLSITFISGGSLAENLFSPEKILPENMQLHGFMSQAFFNSSGNNVYGQSDGGISPGLTEIGLNLNYQPFNNLRFAAQGLYRRAGDVDPGSLRLDYGLVDFTIMDYGSSLLGVRAGRVKTPYGLYNETRDVAFTHPTILLPQGIYFDRSRSLMLSADGGSLYGEQRTDFGDFKLKFNVGMPSNDLDEIKTIVLATDKANGAFTTKPSIATQLSYEYNRGEFIFAVSYLDQEFNYSPLPGEVTFVGMPLAKSTTHIQPLLFSAQYNGENFTLTGEYNYRWNSFGNFAKYGGAKFVTESWYVEGSYRILPKLQATVRYDTISIDKNDRNGDNAVRLQFPRHVAFAQDWVFGLRYDITPSWMVRADYTLAHGTAWLPQADNPIPDNTVQDWDLYALQLSFKF
jgi:hypothetical protein